MGFDLSRLRRSDQIVGGGAITLFIFMFFFKWFGGSAGSSAGGINFSSSANGWHTFTNSRWIWLITILVALGAVALRAGQRELSLSVEPSAIIAALGALSTLLILYRIIHHPSGGVSGTIAGVNYSASYGIKIGIWLGLIAAAAITYGGYLGMQAEGTSLGDAHDQTGQPAGGATASVGSPSEGSASAAAQAGGVPTADPAGGAPAPAAPAPPPIPPPAVPPPSSDA
jgi:hypothetical protein